ncbi:MAG: hypothetical protein GY792_12080 [Gammaproteobacteria bacterium]|nr:hypothetical protein [Gammaproteobacteria bacterium]
MDAFVPRGGVKTAIVSDGEGERGTMQREDQRGVLRARVLGDIGESLLRGVVEGLLDEGRERGERVGDVRLKIQAGALRHLPRQRAGSQPQAEVFEGDARRACAECNRSVDAQRQAPAPNCNCSGMNRRVADDTEKLMVRG